MSGREDFLTSARVILAQLGAAGLAMQELGLE